MNGNPASRESHETAFPLLLLGTVTSGLAIVNITMPSSWVHDAFGFLGSNWTEGLLLTVSFGTVWFILRQRAAVHGTRSPTGFGVGAIIGLVICLPPVVSILIVAGPFLVLGMGLLAAGVLQRSRFLIWWAVLIGTIGIYEGFFGITNRLPAPLWAAWEHQAIYLCLGVLTVFAGLIMRVRENRFQSDRGTARREG